MRPNTPHLVLGPQATISEGGHYYSTSTMQDSAISLIHSFVCSDLITNIAHHPSRMLLREMARFYYLGLVKGVVRPQCKADSTYPLTILKKKTFF